MSTSPSGGSVTLDQLIALNDEMAALVRAGVPLERGLIDASRDLRGRLGEITGVLGDRLGQGERLPEALAHSGLRIPDVYRAVVDAGLRSGRLAKALEGMAVIARGYADARKAIGLAMLYPLIVMSLAYGLGLFFIFQIMPRFVSAFDTFRIATSRPMAFLIWLGEAPIYWVLIPPALFGLLGLGWIWSGRSNTLDSGVFGSILKRIPLVGSMASYFRSANFADLLALLIDHQVPLDESVRLAGDVSGDPAFRHATRAFAEANQAGRGSEIVGEDFMKSFPPLLAWILTTGRHQGDLSLALRHAAGSYRRKAESRAEVIRSALPTVLLLAIGAGAVLLYALLLFIPLTKFWDDLALPINI